MSPPVQHGGTGRLGRATRPFQAHSKCHRSPRSLSLKPSDPPQHCRGRAEGATSPQCSNLGTLFPSAPSQLHSPTPGTSVPPPVCLPDMMHLNQNATRGVSTWRYSRDRTSNTNFLNIAISGAPTAPKVGFRHPNSACGENTSLQPSPSDRPACTGSFSF